LVKSRLLRVREDIMIGLLSQTKLPDPSNPLSDIVGENIIIISENIG